MQALARLASLPGTLEGRSIVAAICHRPGKVAQIDIHAHSRLHGAGYGDFLQRCKGLQRQQQAEDESEPPTHGLILRRATQEFGVSDIARHRLKHGSNAAEGQECNQ